MLQSLLECSLTAFFIDKRVTFFYTDNCRELCGNIKCCL